jgi:hypothetical protein
VDKYPPYDRDVKPREKLAVLGIEDTQFVEWFIRKSIASEKKTPLKTIEDAITTFISVDQH